MNWPRRLTVFAAGSKAEEWRLAKVKINPRINAKDFEPRVRHDD